MKRIGIDARLIGETGVGRYIRNLIHELSTMDIENRYIVFLEKEGFKTFTGLNERWEKRLADIPWHSLKEQMVLPFLFGKEHLDILHVPYFNVPFLYMGNVVVTIHDLIILHTNTGKASTLPFWKYGLKRLGYRIILSLGIAKARHILAVSEATKDDIVQTLHVDASRITVTIEGVDSAISDYKDAIEKEQPRVAGTYFLYVGNAYPHKNLPMLVRAFEEMTTGTRLVLVGKDDFFYQRLRQHTEASPRAQDIMFFGPADDRALANLYRYARALVFPSLAEGFGLPVLEAFSFGTPVLATDIPVFREILGEDGIYFPPTEASVLTRLLEKMANNPVRISQNTIGRRLSHFDWHELAKKTKNVYDMVS